MSPCNVLQSIFYFPTDGRLKIAEISTHSVSTLHGSHLIVIDENYNGSVGGHLLDSIKISNRIDGYQGAISSLTRTLPSCTGSLTTACELAQSLLPPCSHEMLFFVIFGDIRTRALALLSRKVDSFVVHDVVGKGINCLSEASFFSCLKGAGIRYDSFWSSIGVKLGGSREIGSCRRHLRGCIGGQGLLVLVARVEGGAVVV